MVKKKKKDANQSAKEVAEAMVANMTANMKDPEQFWLEKERRMDEAAKIAIAKRKLREENEKKESK